MKKLWQIMAFLRGMQPELRFGDFSHASLRLLRFQLKDEIVECDWIARPAEESAGRLPHHAREQKASLEALQDAMKLGDMLFGLLPGIRQAALRVFRQSAREPPRLIIAGTSTRQLPAVKKVKSLVMRAKLYGFKFWMNDGVLVPLESVERSFGLAT